MPETNLTIYQGSTYSSNITIKNDGVVLDLTDYIISGMIKNNYSDNNALANFQITPLIPTGGIIQLKIPATGTQVLPITTAVYDVEMSYNGTGDITKILYGKVLINPEVTT